MNSTQHLWQWLSGKKTYLIAVAATVYAWGIAHQLWTNDPLLDTAFAGGLAAALRHGWKTEAGKILQAVIEAPPVLPTAPPLVTTLTTMPPPPKSAAGADALQKGAVNVGLLFALGAAVTLGCILLGCAALKPGADGFVVRVEQAQSAAKPGFDFVLHTEDANREFWHTNTPGFYDFCEWLRQPQPVTGMTAFSTNISMDLPRASAMQWNLDQVKTAYKAGKATSNEVFVVLETLESAVTQASTWSSFMTNGVGKAN